MISDFMSWNVFVSTKNLIFLPKYSFGRRIWQLFPNFFGICDWSMYIHIYFYYLRVVVFGFRFLQSRLLLKPSA